MKINGFEVSLSHQKDDVWIAFDIYAGTLKEMLEFRRSFDYECYSFGNSQFNYAKWKTIIADDHSHQGYPREIGLYNPVGNIIISWQDFEDLLFLAKEFAASAALK